MELVVIMSCGGRRRMLGLCFNMSVYSGETGLTRIQGMFQRESRHSLEIVGRGFLVTTSSCKAFSKIDSGGLGRFS